MNKLKLENEPNLNMWSYLVINSSSTCVKIKLNEQPQTFIVQFETTYLHPINTVILWLWLCSSDLMNTLFTYFILKSGVKCWVKMENGFGMKHSHLVQLTIG